MARPRRLDAEEVGRQLAGLPAWTGDVDRLTRTLAFPDFRTAIRGVDEIAEVAEEMDHHPDLEVGYNYCRVRFTTHAIRGLSENDFICAAKIDLIPLA